MDELLSNRGAEISSPVAPQECSHAGECVEFLRSRWAKEARSLDRRDFFDRLPSTEVHDFIHPRSEAPLSGRGVQSLLLTMSHAWDHPWESLRGVLDGVTEEEAAFSAEAYRDLWSDDSVPRAGSIHAQVNHLTGCKLYYISVIPHVLGEGTALREDDRVAPEPTFAAEFARLEEVRAREFDQLATLTEDDLDRTTPGGTSLLEFIAATIRHDSWHAGQIAVARRLFRSRDTSS